MTDSTSSDLSPRSTLPYLKLLHEQSPDGVLDAFCSLVRDDPYFELNEEPDLQANPELESFLTWDDAVSDERLDFMRWWIDQYRREVVRKYDQLTGLYNRSYWERELRPRFRDSHSSRTLVLADIDHFKRFNDEYGHAMGDKVLDAIGTIMREVFSETACCVRYGGEEFLVVSEQSYQDTKDHTESFRRTVRSGDHFEDQPEQITVSLGLSGPGEEGKTLDERLEEADLALYSSKTRGRDRVTEFSPYMRHRESLSVWGFHRYLWNKSVQFAFETERTFYLQVDNSIRKYSWSNDKVSSIEMPDDEIDARSMKYLGGRLHLLDDEGNLWSFQEGDWRNLRGDHPPMVTVTGGPENVFAVGLNNQLYQFDRDGVTRRESLPERWDRLLFLNGIYFVVDNQLKSLEEDSLDRWTLPASPLDFTSGGGELVMCSDAGNLYAFDKSVNHWKQLILPKFLGRRINARNINREGNNFLIHDSNGRLLLASKDNKSVPQKMRLDL